MCSLAADTSLIVSGKDRNDLFCLVALVIFANWFLFAFRTKLQPLEPEVGERHFRLEINRT